MIAEKVTSLKNTFSNSNMFLRAYFWKLRYFKPKVSLFIETRRFLIKTVENCFELKKALNLRYEVFYEELLNKKTLLGMDVDGFDSICDHLIITDIRIGTD